MLDGLEKALVPELTTAVSPAVRSFAASVARQLPTPPLGVLFYGSMLRKEDPDGILDFYVVTETGSDVPGGAVMRLANRLLPPNVFYSEHCYEGQVYRAKIAVLSRKQFMNRTGPRSTDTTLWARFCQPVRLVWVRDVDAADYVLNLMARCVTTAAFWAGALAVPGQKQSAVAYWDGLFARTYGSELRVESSARPKRLIEGAEERFAQLLPLAWARAGLAFTFEEGLYALLFSERQCQRAVEQWQSARRFGKILNVLRLLKAAFTFKDGAAYLAWKIQRHTGIDLKLSAFEQRHPLVCLPLLLWRYRKEKSASVR